MEGGYGRKLSMLEGIAALAGVLVAMARFPGIPVTIREDNAGLVYVYRKGTCRCPWTWTVAKAIYDLGKARFTSVVFEKVGRRSLPMDEVADHLSKGELSQARNRLSLKPMMEEFPRSFWEWVNHPRVDPGLGWKLARDLEGLIRVRNTKSTEYV